MNLVRSKALRYLSLLVFSVTALAGSGFAAGVEKHGKVVLVTVDNISWSDLKGANDRDFNELIRTSAVGLLNVRVDGGSTRSKEYISAGASARSSAPDEVLGLDSNEPYESGTAGEVYERRLGEGAPRNGAVALDQVLIAPKNKKLSYDIFAGALGQSLADSGKKVAVVGNSDISLKPDEGFHREIIYLAMSEKGRVDFSDTGKDVLRTDPTAPYGIRTNERAVLKRFQEYYKKADFIAIDSGDTVRADMYYGFADPSAAWRMKSQAIARTGKLIKEIKGKLSKDDLLIVASLTPPGTGIPISRGYEVQLTPMFVSGRDFSTGYITSDSTHRDGLVTNLDIAPTVLSAMGIKAPVTMFGRQLEYASAPERTPSIDRLIAFNAQAMGVNAARTGVIVSFAVILGIALFGTVTLVLLRRRFSSKALTWTLKVATLSVLAFPLSSFVLTYYLGTASAIGLTAAIIAGAFLASALALLVGRKGLVPPAILAGATLVFFAFDMMTGARFNVDSIFTYDTIVGGRFYGMGNEAYSVAIGAGIILFMALARIGRPLISKILIGLLGLGIALLVAHPALGSNLGGAPTVIVSIFAFLVLMRKEKLKASTVLIGAGLVVLSGFAFVGIDLAMGAKTHVGRTAQLILSGGFHQFQLLAVRRITENLQVFQASAWAYVLLVIVPITAILRYRPGGHLERILKERHDLAIGFSTALISGLVGYLLEDSGIVIPAIILAQFIPVVAYMMLSEGSVDA